MAIHTVEAAGQIVVVLKHPLWNNGTPTIIDGFKLEGQMVQAQQSMDSSKIIPLANGNTITITNSVDAGTLTFNVCKTLSDGDMAHIANYLRRTGDAIGGQISITQSANGKDIATTFYGCTVKSCPPLNVQGNDAADYQVVWNYAYSETPELNSANDGATLATTSS